jgi:hypothetical protein
MIRYNHEYDRRLRAVYYYSRRSRSGRARRRR